MLKNEYKIKSESFLKSIYFYARRRLIYNLYKDKKENLFTLSLIYLTGQASIA